MNSKIYTIVLFITIILTLQSCSDDDNTVLNSNLPVLIMPQSENGFTVIDPAEVLNSGNYLYEFEITLDKPTATTMLCSIDENRDLVEAYNKNHGTLYKQMPTSIYSLVGTNGIIKAGETKSNTLSILFTSLYGLTEGEKYLLPIVTILDASVADQFQITDKSVSYLSISSDFKIDYIPGLDMRTYSTSMYTKLNLPNNEIVIIDENTHTFEMMIYPYSWHSGTNYIGTWSGNDINNNNEAFSGCELRVTGTSGASNIGNRQADLTLANNNIIIKPNQWNLISVTCDGTKTGQNTEIAYRLYINGELVSEKAPSKRFGPTSSQRFKVGYTLTGMQFGMSSSSYYFDGLISEIRMWKKCLTEEEIRANLREVKSPSSTEMYAYWKLDEGEGNILKDSSGNGRNLTFSPTTNVAWSAEFNKNLGLIE